MTTVDELVADAQAEMWGMVAPILNQLDGAYTSGATTVTLLRDPTGLAPGRFIAIDDEVLLVTDVSGTSLTVVGAQLATAAANHADGALVEVAPRYPRARIIRALRQEILSWPSTLYYVASTNIDGAADRIAYELAAPYDDALDVLAVAASPDSLVDSISTRSWPTVRFRFDRDADPTGFSSGKAVVVVDPYVGDLSNRTLRVTLARPFNLATFTGTTDLEDDCLIPEQLHEVVTWGALWRLLAPREVKRSNTEAQPGESRRADEVPAGAALSAALQFKRLRDTRLREEEARLARLRGAAW